MLLYFESFYFMLLYTLTPPVRVKYYTFPFTLEGAGIVSSSNRRVVSLIPWLPRLHSHEQDTEPSGRHLTQQLLPPVLECEVLCVFTEMQVLSLFKEKEKLMEMFK